jgi:hypothetical protein
MIKESIEQRRAPVAPRQAPGLSLIEKRADGTRVEVR